MDEIAAITEHTLLKPTASKMDIARLCSEAVAYKLFGVCVAPCNVRFAKQFVNKRVKVISVVGFPLGSSSMRTKQDEACRCVFDGADEIDVVMNIGRFKEQDDGYVAEEFKNIIGDHHIGERGVSVKAIIEAGLLTDEEKVRITKLCNAIGVSFVKTSTGFLAGGATVHDVKLIAANLRPGMGLKASGGVKTREQAMALKKAGATRIGSSCGHLLTNAAQLNL